jgi:hypothetical protein
MVRSGTPNDKLISDPKWYASFDGISNHGAYALRKREHEIYLV